MEDMTGWEKAVEKGRMRRAKEEGLRTSTGRREPDSEREFIAAAMLGVLSKWTGVVG